MLQGSEFSPGAGSSSDQTKDKDDEMEKDEKMEKNEKGENDEKEEKGEKDEIENLEKAFIHSEQTKRN